MISLVFDTETTGFATKSHTDPNNGKLLQVYAALYEHDPKVSYISGTGKDIKCTAKPFATLSTLVDAGIDVPAQAFAVHGIDRTKAARLGADPTNVACILEDFCDVADRIVAHNISFDVSILKHALWAAGRDPSFLDNKDKFCTMQTLKPIMQLGPKKYGDWRYPKLIDSYRFLYDRDFEGEAHDASADAIACAEIYFGLLTIQQGAAA